MCVGHLYVFFGKMSIQVLCPFFNRIVWGFLILSCMSCLYILDINLLLVIICKYFLPFSRLCFHFVDGFLCCAKAFKFNQVALVYFCFCFLCLRKQIKKYCYDLCQRVFCLCFLLGVFWFPVSQPVLNDYWPKSTHQVEDNIVTDFMHV